LIGPATPAIQSAAVWASAVSGPSPVPIKGLVIIVVQHCQHMHVHHLGPGRIVDLHRGAQGHAPVKQLQLTIAAARSAAKVAAVLDDAILDQQAIVVRTSRPPMPPLRPRRQDYRAI
jgi:hypothetical protein